MRFFQRLPLVTIVELLQAYITQITATRAQVARQGFDTPVPLTVARKQSTVGTVHLYRVEPAGHPGWMEDVPLTIILPGEQEPIEGTLVGQDDQGLLVQTWDTMGDTVSAPTVVPDCLGFFDLLKKRFADVAAKPEAYHLGPAERFIPWLEPEQTNRAQTARAAITSTALGTIWHEDPAARRTQLATTIVELVRKNKRILIISPTHRSADEVTGMLARTLRAAGLPFKSLVSRYEVPATEHSAGMPIHELCFEAQMHQFFAKSRSDKASLRRKYERFRELTPMLAYKAEKQRDLNEVKLLEWRLLTQLSDLQNKIKDIETTLAEYENLPIWKRLAMQTVGKNVASLAEYRTMYQGQMQNVYGELEVAQRRIAVLTPEAAIPKDIRPEYKELKDDIKRLGGTKKIREMLAAEEGTNRQAFLQNKRLVITTPGRIVTDPLFARVRFDVLIADEAPWIQGPLLLAAACTVHERVIVSGNPNDIAISQAWEPTGTWFASSHTPATQAALDG
jgi:hypothetical protein